MDITDKICNICLMICDNTFSAKAYKSFFTDVLGYKDLKVKFICIWCTVSLKKVIKFVKLIENSQNKFKSSEVKRSNHHPSTLTIYRNESIDISPFDEICLNENNLIEKSLNVNENVEKEADTVICENESPNYKEMQFEVKFLTIEEQKDEINKKKTFEKYLNKPYKCEKCGISFLTDDVYEDHEKRHMETFGPHKCGICDLKFKSALVLTQHLLSHSRNFVCNLCNMVFKRWNQANCHRFKCGYMKFMAACEICKKIFDNNHSLKVHIQGVHKKEKKFICEYCKDKFSTKQRLRVHIRSHTGVKPFNCDICNKKFTTSSNLKYHQTTHTKRKDYYCVECNTLYKSGKSLKKHLNESKKHVRDCEKRYSCTVCSKQFSSETSLSSHIKGRHLTSHECDICNKTFSSNSNLKKHIRCIHGPRE
ncbi:unnamed protein product, partial [Brenthis ino]